MMIIKNDRYAHGNPAIANAAKGYNAILNYLKTRTIHNAATRAEIEAACRDAVTGPQQISDALRKYHAQHLVLRIKEGKEVRWYFNTTLSETQRLLAMGKQESRLPKNDLELIGAALRRKNMQPGEVISLPKPSGKPDITVTDTYVSIETDKFTLRVEFK